MESRLSKKVIFGLILGSLLTPAAYAATATNDPGNVTDTTKGVAISETSKSTGSGVAIGENTEAGNQSVAIGSDSTYDGTTYSTTAVGGNSVAIGGGAYAQGLSVAIGELAGAGNTNTIGSNVNIGHWAGRDASGGDNIAIGYNSGMRTSSGDNVALGLFAGRNVSQAASNPVASGIFGNNVAVGSDAGTDVVGDTNTGIGWHSGWVVTGSGNTATGAVAGNQVTGNQNSGFGDWAGQNVTGSYNVGLGHASGQNIEGDNNVALGRSAGQGITANRTIAVGYRAKANSDDSIYIGTGGSGATYGVTGTQSGAIGYENLIGSTAAPVTNSYVLGSNNTVTAQNAFVLGNNVSNNIAGSVVLGNGSTVAAAEGTSAITIKGTTYDFAGGNPTSTVSVGSSGAERTITNVAAGRVTNLSTDAINGSQLYAATQAIENMTSANQTHFYSVNNTDSSAGNYNNNGATGTNALAAGVGATAAGTSSIAIGNGATTLAATAGLNAVAIGTAANAGELSVAIGQNAGTGNTNIANVYIGHRAGEINNTSTTGGEQNIGIGYESGQNMVTSENTTIGLWAGRNNTSILTDWRAGHNIMLGSSAGEGSTGDMNVNIGQASGRAAYGIQNVTIGRNAGVSANGNNNFYSATGAGYGVTGDNNVAIGYLANSSDPDLNPDSTAVIANSTVALGNSTRATANNAIAIGSNAQATAVNAISIGTGNVVSGANSGAIGDPSTVSGAGSYSVGNDNTITAANAFVLGNNVTNGVDGSVVLGNNSTVATAVGTAGVTIGTTPYTFAGGNPTSTVSVGSSGTERTITNVAAGRVTGTSTDAINGSQLYAATQAIENMTSANQTHFYSVNSTDSTAGNYNNNGATGTNALAAGVGATAAGENAVAIGTNATSAVLGGVALGSGSVVGNPMTTSEGVVNGITHSYAGIASSGVSVGNVGAERQVQNVAAGRVTQTSTDAVNGSQLYWTNYELERVGKGWNLTTSGDTSTTASTVAPGKTVDFVPSDGNVTVTHTQNSDGNVSVGFGLADIVTIGNTATTRVTINGTTGTVNGLTNRYWSSTYTVTPGQAATEDQLKFVSETLGNSTFGLMDTNGDTITKSLGATISVVGADSNITTDVKDGKLQIALSNNLDLPGGSVDFGDTVIDNSGIKITNTTTNTTTSLTDNSLVIGGNTYITNGGITANNQTITNVANPVNIYDAVNLNTLNTTVAANKTHFYSVNSTDSTAGNYNNDGATGTNALAAGVGATAAGTSSIAIGNGATTTADTAGLNAVAIGTLANAGELSVAIGQNAGTGNSNISNVYIGHRAGEIDNAAITTTGEQNIGIGDRSGQNLATSGNITVGLNAGRDSTSILADGDWRQGHNILVGANAGYLSTGDMNVYIGQQAGQSAQGILNVTFGKDAGREANGNSNFYANERAGFRLTGNNNIAIGYYANNGWNISGTAVDADNTVALGYRTLATQDNAIAIGSNAQATAVNAISIGTGNVVSGENSGAIGDPSTVSGANSYSVGNNNTVTADNAFVLGNNVTNGVNGSVVLGNNSTVATAVGTAGVTIGTTPYTFAGGNPSSTVSVGASGAERTITNLAAGQISATSTNAINGSQLFATNSALEDLITTVDAGWDLATSGDTNTSASTVALGKTVDFTGADANVTVTHTQDANGNVNVGFGLADTVHIGTANPVTINGETGRIGGLTNTTWTSGGAITSGQAATEDQLQVVSNTANAGWNLSTEGGATTNVAPGATVDFSNDDNNILVTNDGRNVNFNLANTVTIGAATGNPVTINGETGRIGGLTNTTWTPGGAITSGQAATEDQLQVVSNTANAGWNLSTEGGATTNVAPGATVDFSNDDNNILVTNDGRNVNFNLANTVTIGAATGNPVTINGETGRIGGLTNTTWTPGGAITSGQAATEDQLQVVSNTANAGWNLSTEGGTATKVAPGATVDFSSANDNIAVTNTGTDILFTLANNLELGNTGSVTFGNTYINNSGLVINGGSTSLIDNSLTIGGNTYITNNGINANYQTITNVANAVNEGDAVNLSQLNEVRELAGAGWNLSTGGGAATNVAPTKTVDFSSTDGNVTVTHTTDSNGNVSVDLGLADVVTIGDANPVVIDGTKGEITGLTNTTWDPDNVVADRAATEGQLSDLDSKIDDVATTAGKHSSVVAGKNMTVTEGTNTAGGIAYTVGTSDDLSANSYTAIDATTNNSTVINSNSVTITDGTTNNTTVVNSGGITINNSSTGNSVSLTENGLNNGGNTITNVGNGVNDTDAANMGQVRSVANELGNLSGEIRDVGALSAALTALKPIQYDPLEPTQIMAGVGFYRNSGAIALGIAHYKNESTMFHAGVAYAGGGSNLMANAGVTWKVGNKSSEAAVADHYRRGPISSAYAMQNEVASLKSENAGLKTEVTSLTEQTQAQQTEMQRMREEMAAIKARLGM